MTDNPIQGQQGATSAGSDFNAHAFVIRQLIGRVNTATLVQVKAVTNNGGLSPVGFVDVLPLVNQIDGAGNATPHATIHNLPYFRLQGGGNAVILDPQIGDIGIAVFASRDISSVKANKAQANPGSRRQFDMADGLYVGGVLNGVPSQYVQFTAGGINIVSPSAVTIQAPDVKVQAQTAEVNASTSATVTTPTLTIDASASATVNTPTFTVNGATQLNGPVAQGAGSGGGTTATFIGPLNVTNDVTAGNISLEHHVHGGVMGGSSNTGTPI